LDRYKTSGTPPPKIHSPLADRRLSLWRKGVAFLRGVQPSGQISPESAAYWGEETVFRKLFSRLDHADIMQIGCGDGEHSAHVLRLYLPRAITLVDDSQACMARFAGESRVSFVHMGELDAIADGSRSA